jgi:hypothetical protein
VGGGVRDGVEGGKGEVWRGLEGRGEGEGRGDTHDRAHGGDDLSEDGGGHRFGVDHGVRAEAEARHDVTVSGDVACEMDKG